ncbi:MAG: hypothetical protein AB8B56_19930, partial [Crocinitomicaceae bacterium]
MDCFQDADFPMKQVVCLFRSVSPNQLADPGPQLEKVLDFKRRIEEEKQLLYSNFSSINEFTDLIRRNLSKWLRDDNSEEGGYVLPNDPLEITPEIIPVEEDFTQTSDAHLEEMIDRAWSFAKEGKLVDAE